MLEAFEKEPSARLDIDPDIKRDSLIGAFARYQLDDEKGRYIYKELVRSADFWKKYNILDEIRIKDKEKFYQPSDEAKLDWRQAHMLVKKMINTLEH